MKTELKAKYIQHLINKKNADEGFTLIELLVVIIIIGILSAIALPSFLNQANKARESEAKQYIGAINRGQQAYYVEEQEFTTEIAALGVGIDTDTKNYGYSIPTGTQVETISLAAPTNTSTLRGMVGGVDLGLVGDAGDSTTRAILCQKETPGDAAAAGVTLSAGTTTEPDCGAGFEPLD